jgi:hypothetical protein
MLWFRGRQAAVRVSVLLCGFTLSAAGGNAVAASLTLVPEAGPHYVGSEVLISIQVDSLDQNLVVADAIIYFDPTALRLMEIDTDSSAFAHDFGFPDEDAFPIKVVDNVRGDAQVVAALPSPGISGVALEVAKLRFQALAEKPQTIVIVSYLGEGGEGDSALILDDGFGTDILNQAANADLVIEAEEVDSGPVLLAIPEISVEASEAAFDRRTGGASYNFTLRNTGGTIAGPFYLVLSAITPAGIPVRNPDEINSAGDPVLVFNVEQLDAGASLKRTVIFENPARLRFSFASTVYRLVE